MNQLTTFIAPTPNKLMMTALMPINRWVNLKGLTFLHCLPMINKMPLIRGLCDITNINFPEFDKKKLKQTVNKNTVSFIAPNHPEFYTDWMLDKEVSSLVAPKMASWATHDVVNGMGKTMQKFWLKNNLIAQIPGTGNESGKNYSIEQALQGHSVLLHPEGHVGWHSDIVSPLFSGVVDMAYDAFIRSEGKKEVYIAPVVWKLSFNSDAFYNLHKEMDLIEKKLKIQSTKEYLQLNTRLKLVLLNIFLAIAKNNNITVNNEMSVVATHSVILNAILEKINANLYIKAQDHTVASNIKEINKVLKINKNVYTKEIKMLKNAMNHLASFDFSYFKYSLTQENIAELLQKVRIEFCDKTLLDKIHRFVPRPVQSRTAHIRTPDAVLVNKTIELGIGLGMSKVEIKTMMLKTLEHNMQSSLDMINQKLNKEKMANTLWC